MQLTDWNEDAFIEFLKSQFHSTNTITGIGDDCAIIPTESGKAWLITTDALVEGVHFLKEQIPPKELGYKAIAVNVSDIAAMGGKPQYAFLTIAIPKSVERSWITEVIQGIKEACNKWDLQLLGGDTVGSKRDLFFNVTLTGSAEVSQIKYRHQALPGDIICVTGYLGNAGGGLKALQENTPKTQDVEQLLQAHFHPIPYPEQGMWLGSQQAVHAMMDISDGLDCDLKKLLKSSQKGAKVETSQIPISSTLTRASSENGWDSLQLALTGGEDYCLLVTVSKDDFFNIQHAFQEQFKTPLFPIGSITDPPEQTVYHKQGQKFYPNYPNFSHF